MRESPPPERAPAPWRSGVLWLLGALALAWSAWMAEVKPAVLWGPGAHGLLAFARQLFPPSLEPGFLGVVLLACLRTLSIAVAGTALSVLGGLPLGVLATATLFRRGILLAGERRGPATAALSWLSACARGLLRFLRAVPDVVWALLFVVAFGLGPLAGALALGVSYAGVIGRVFADLFEEAPALPAEALHAAGASRLQVFLFAIWPQTAPSVAAYALYSFECCVRAATVLGFIGAGGIGYEIAVSMRLFEYGQVTTLLFAFLVLVLATDAVSRRLRRGFRRQSEVTRVDERLRRTRFFTAPHAQAKLTPAAGPSSRWRRGALLGGTLVAIALCFADAGFFGAGIDRGMPGRLARFAGELLPLDLSQGFLRSLWTPLGQTLATSVIGTVMGIVLGGALAIPATAALIRPPPDSPGRTSPARALLRSLVHAGSRAALALLRSIPELLWVLLCVVAVGLGPFAGTLALGLHTAGVLGKLFAETLEEVPEKALLPLRAAGATPLQVLTFGMWPQSRATLWSYALLRWENNLRVSTVVGLVGGGGLGLALYTSVQLGFYGRVSTLVLLVYLLVVATDVVSERARARTRGGEMLEPAAGERSLEAIQA